MFRPDPDERLGRFRYAWVEWSTKRQDTALMALAVGVVAATAAVLAG